MPTENKITAPEESAGVDFGIDGRSVRVSQEAYSIFLAREAAGREKIAALQQRLTAADERVDVLEGRISMLVRELQELINDDDGILVAAELSTGFVWHALQKHGKSINSALTRADGVVAPATCTWQFGAFSWHTACGQEWMLNDGTPEQNGMRFCHSCGKTLVMADEDENDDD